MDVPAGTTVPFTFVMDESISPDDINVTVNTDLSSTAPRETTTVSYTATAHPKTIAGSGSYAYRIDVTNLPLKYREGNLVIQLDISTPKAITTDTHPFDFTLSGSWVSDDGQSFPSDMVQFDKGSSNLTNQIDGVSVVKRALVRAITTTSICSKSNPSFAPNGHLLITVTNNASTAIKINDIQNTLTFLYNKEEYS